MVADAAVWIGSVLQRGGENALFDALKCSHFVAESPGAGRAGPLGGKDKLMHPGELQL